MKIHKIKDMKDGWFIGNFEPSILRTDKFEVGVKHHKKNEKYHVHYHREVIEYNVLLTGEMTIQGERLIAGDIFVLGKLEVADPEFHEDCLIVCVKVPSIPSDKHIV